MDIVPSNVPAPRLLVEIAPEPEQELVRPRASRFGRWSFLAVVPCIALGLAALKLHDRYLAYRERERELRLLQVSTRNLAAGAHPSETPQPMTIQYSSEMIQVTAIALGHPRLAVINGRTVGEGDSVILHTPVHSVAISLRVVTIADGYVDLCDGQHTVRANLDLPSAKPKQP